MGCFTTMASLDLADRLWQLSRAEECWPAQSDLLMDKTICIWNAQAGDQVGNSIQGHINCVRSVAFSPDGRHIVSGSDDKTIQVWDAQTGAPVGKPLQGHTSTVMSVAFSPDGEHIVSGSIDKTIRVWDTQAQVQIDDDRQSMKFLPINFSILETHALQHARSLFIDFSSNVKGYGPLPIYFDSDGWVVGPNGKLLLWVPPSYHPIFVATPWTKFIIAGGLTELDLSQMKHGLAWAECYSGTAIVV